MVNDSWLIAQGSRLMAKEDARELGLGPRGPGLFFRFGEAGSSSQRL